MYNMFIGYYHYWKIKIISPIQDNYHPIHLQPRSVPPNLGLTKPHAQKSEIEHMVEKILETCIIQPSWSDFSH